MSEFVQGQRWVVDSEPELGLGLVVTVANRAVDIFFPLADCERRYAPSQAPLTRITYAEGDEIQLHSGESHTVISVVELDGLFVYEVEEGRKIPETQLTAEIQLNQPFMRLMTGQLDKAKWFYFRRELDAAMARTWASGLRGFLGVRANLIPHQLFVAKSACEREQVRVLLSDEVGLGKTLEAGMILNRLLKLERVKRALIIVPDALQVQWLVELIRRFSIFPSMYDGEGYDFAFGQIHIMSHAAMLNEHEKLLEAEFDLVIVDECHHIEANTPAFECLEDLALEVEHLVLVTATPEQLGFSSHFSRLRLLDPAKYRSEELLHAEEEKFAELNIAIRSLPEGREALLKHYTLDDNLDDEHLVNQLLDCHGVGRVMFRNSRSTISGFPKRIAQTHIIADNDWETRYEWLAQFLKSTPKRKVLVICHEKENVLACEQYLWNTHGMDAAVFHEDMDLIERDRAAEYFADDERGARVLLCSEIGSEGRNFQFCHHLLCLDLPEHPDLLEQRIGRLDRIGQNSDVNIHVAFSENSELEQRWHWLNDVLDCICRQSPAAGTVHDALWPGDVNAVTPELMQQASAEVKALEEKIEQGRNALLEMNSCREPQASALADSVRVFEEDSPLPLVTMASELLQFHFEDLGSGSYSLVPSDKMLLPSLPGISPDGVEVTFDRELACSREDLVFMTWDSPFITGLWELLHHSELGSAALALLPSRQLPAGKCLIEASFDFIVQADCSAQCLPFLPQQSLRCLMMEGNTKDLSAALDEKALQKSIGKVDKKIARKIIQSRKEILPEWLECVEGFAQVQKATLADEACARVREFFATEKSRLEKLASLNSGLSREDIDDLIAKEEHLTEALLNKSIAQLSGIRLIVTTEP